MRSVQRAVEECKMIVAGVIAGFIVGWLIAALKTGFIYLGGGYGMFEGPGCFATPLIEAVCTAIGAGVGALLQQSHSKEIHEGCRGDGM